MPLRYNITGTMSRALVHTSMHCFHTGAQVLRGPAVTPKRQKTVAAVPKRAENEEHAVAMAEARAVANQEVRSASIVAIPSFTRLQFNCSSTWVLGLLLPLLCSASLLTPAHRPHHASTTWLLASCKLRSLHDLST